MSKPKVAADIRLLLSPVDRMFFTYSIPEAKHSFEILTDEPVFIFGSLQNDQPPSRIDSIEKALSHLDILPGGLFYVLPSKVDLDIFKEACLSRKALLQSGANYTFTLDGKEFAFSTTESLRDQAKVQTHKRQY